MNNNIRELEIEIKKLEQEKDDFDYDKESINNQIKYLKEILYQQLIEPKTPDLSDGVIDLYKTENNNENNYTIYLNGTDTCIGFIDYRGHGKSDIGDIGYGIKEKYRGNNYSLRALNLISQDILQDGIDEVFIFANCDNISSIKIIEKFGGVLYKKENDILCYKCNLIDNKKVKK